VSGDREAAIWNVRTGELHRTMQGHAGGVTCLAMWSVERRDLRMEGGRRLMATGSVDATCKLWSTTADNRCLRTYEGHDATVTAVMFGGDANHEILVSTCMDRTTRVWQLSSVACLAVLPEVSACRCGVWAASLLGAERPAIVTGSYGDAKIWRVPHAETDRPESWAKGAKHRCVQVFAKTEGRVHCVRVKALFDRRAVVVTASHDTVHIWAPVLDANGVRAPFTLEWLVAFAASGIVQDSVGINHWSRPVWDIFEPLYLAQIELVFHDS
jgi:WD40 repeat protein